MEAKNIEIDQFKSIEDIYGFIDQYAFDLKRGRDLTNLWVRYRDYATVESEKQKAQWEIDCFLFDIRSNRIFSQVYSSDSSISSVSRYPDIKDFQEEVVEYVKWRAVTSTNPILKARYYHLLWKSPTGIKHNSHAVAAITPYFDAITGYHQLYLTTSNEETQLKIGKLFESLVAVSNEISADTEPLKELTKKLLFQSPSLEFYAIHGILKDMLAHPKLFKAKDFENTLTLFDNHIERIQKRADDFSLVHYYLPTALKIAAKIKSDIKKWHNEKGLAYLRMAAEELEEDRFWIKQDYHAKAINSFTLSGNKVYQAEAERLYAALKPKVKLPTVRVDFDEDTQKKLRDFQDHIKKLANVVLKQTPDYVYGTIASGYFFPKYVDVVNASKNDENSFLNFVTTINFDRNKNITKQQKESQEEREIYTTYSYQIQLSVLPYLHAIFVPGIKSGHLSFDNLLGYLVSHTWIGKSHIKYDLGGEERSTNWVALLAPAIVEFFLQIQAWGSSKYYQPSFVLCIDSLTLKIEGLLREFCARLSIPTSVDRKKGMQEAYIHNVLENETFIKYFDEDDRLFFNFLFANEGGLNLRNNVAHCFYDYDDYGLDKGLLLIAALLRIAKYNLKFQDSIEA